MPSALITGAGGFVGAFLCQHLDSLGYEVTGITLHGRPQNCQRALTADIREAQTVKDIVTDIAPDEIYHLAGITRPTLEGVNDFYDVNLHGTVNLLEAARQSQARVLIVSSAYVYGQQNGLIDEYAQLRPVNHYGASKAAADLAAITYAFDDNHIVRVRPFNHSGPGQPPDFLLPSLVRQVARIEAGVEPPTVKLGNMDSVRDFSDVRDVVQAYPLLLQHGENGAVYNLASGRGLSVAELVGAIRRLARVSFQVESESTRRRARDIPSLVGDASAAAKIGAWRPRCRLEKTLADMLELEREKYR